MPVDPDAPHCYDFGYAEQYHYQMLPSDQLSQAARRPGLYAWYLRLPNPQTGVQPQDVEAFAKMHASKRFTITANATLGEAYHGVAKRNINMDGKPNANAALLSAVSAVFCPPVYIGISNDIRVRLTTHRRALIKTLNGSRPALGVASGTGVVNDTEAESAKFGQRIGSILRAQGLSHPRWLFVKIVYSDTLGGGKLSDVEYLVNRIFTPFGGRR